MKQSINFKEKIPESISKFILIWKSNKGYDSDDNLTIGQTIELLVATTYNLHKDHSDGRFYDKLLLNEESSIGWQGEELIDILFYEAAKNIEKRLWSSGTFNDTTT